MSLIKEVAYLKRRGQINSITIDNGAEFMAFDFIEKALKIPVCFARPCKAPDKPDIEHLDALRRQSLPKGRAFRDLFRKEIIQIEQQLNTRLRKKIIIYYVFQCFNYLCYTLDLFNTHSYYSLMKEENALIKEHLSPTALSIEEEAYLAGIVCGIRSTYMFDSGITYIVDLESRHILWISIPSISRLGIGQTEQPLTIETLSIYSDTERKKINTLDSYALKFIQSVDPYNIGEYVATSYVSVGGCIYERRISFLSLGRASVPRLMVCKLSVSSHSHIALPKIMRNGDNHYYRLRHMSFNWVKKDLIKLSRREQLILQLSAEGLKEAEIAARIHVSLPRLKSIKGAMFERMHVNNLCQAVRRAHSFGLIVPDFPLEE